MFRKLDNDGDGTMTLEELEVGATTHHEFSTLLRTMDITHDELEAVFMIIDADNSGSVTQDEFCEQLTKMKSQDSHTLLTLMKHQLGKVEERLHRINKVVESNALARSETNSQDFISRQISNLSKLSSKKTPSK